MDKPISVGDLVQIIKWPCCDKWVGAVYRVAQTFNRGEGACAACGKPSPDTSYAGELPGRDAYLAPISWLKRIPPLGELGDVRRDEKLTEPA